MASKRSPVKRTGIHSDTTSLSQPSSQQVLIVEDEVLLAREIESHLLSLGYRIPAIARSASEAILILNHQSIDVVLMDITLGGEMDGITAASYVRQTFHLPIVYLTAYSDVHMLHQATSTCPSGYLMKPCTTADLQITLEIALAQHQFEGQLRQELRDAERRSTVNKMTGILTAHRLLAMAEKEFHRARRYGHPFSVMMLNTNALSRFKCMESESAQQAVQLSDRFVVTVANTAQKCLRQADYIGHLSEDGLGVILPETDAQSATAVAERIRHTLAKLSPEIVTADAMDIDAEKGTVPEAESLGADNQLGDRWISISIGLADWHPTDADVMAVVQRAADSLAKAQRRDGNTIEIHPVLFQDDLNGEHPQI